MKRNKPYYIPVSLRNYQMSNPEILAFYITKQYKSEGFFKNDFL